MRDAFTIAQLSYQTTYEQRRISKRDTIKVLKRQKIINSFKLPYGLDKNNNPIASSHQKGKIHRIQSTLQTHRNGQASNNNAIHTQKQKNKNAMQFYWSLYQSVSQVGFPFIPLAHLIKSRNAWKCDAIVGISS
jgi:hypothetical protein